MAGESSEVNALEVAFTDQFEQKDLAGWVLDPSQWAFTNHGIQMVALGNSVAKTGNPQWTDFEYHASFTVHQFGATSAGGVTLLIRTNMSGPIKTYTLDFLKRGEVRFRVRDFTQMPEIKGDILYTWRDFQFEAGKEYTVRVVVSGNTFQIYINDMLAFTVTDPKSTVTAGAIGIQANDCLASFSAIQVLQAGKAEDVAIGDKPLVWLPPPTFNPKESGLGLPQLEGAVHQVIYDPLPMEANASTYPSLRHGTYNHDPRIVLIDHKFIVYWNNHAWDENGPGGRLLGKVGTFSPDLNDIHWGGEETLVELLPPPVPVSRRPTSHDASTISETRPTAALRLFNGRLYVTGRMLANHGYTNDLAYAGSASSPIPEHKWNDQYDPATGYKWDTWWYMGYDVVQRWRIEGNSLVADSPMYNQETNTPPAYIEVTPNRLKKVLPPLEPYSSAQPVSSAPLDMRVDLTFSPVMFHRVPYYSGGNSKLTVDGTNGLSHATEYQRPDGKWVVIRDNAARPGYYYAAVKEKAYQGYPPAVQTNLFGHAWAVAGELPDKRVWIIGSNPERTDMYLTLSQDGIVFDKTWSILTAHPEIYPGLFKMGGPQYFKAVVVADNIWVVYSLGKEQIGVTKIPISSLGI